MQILRIMMYMLLPCSFTHPYCARRFSMLQYWCIYQESKIHTSTCKRADKVGCAIAEFKQDEATRVRCPIRGDGRTTARGRGKGRAAAERPTLSRLNAEDTKPELPFTAGRETGRSCWILPIREFPSC